MPTNKSKKFFRVSAENFKNIPGHLIAYWVSLSLSQLFRLKTIESVSSSLSNITTI